MAYKLLLADDSITIQKVVELILTDEGFDIRITSDGEEALAIIPSFMPDVILADIEMPRINGYQLCKKIKQDPSMRDIPVILLSSAFEPIDEKLARQVNADDFIIKPFESQELINKINAVLVVSTVMEREEAEFIVEAVESEEATVKEDLWATEETEEIPESAEVEAWSAEKGTEAGTEELTGIAKEAEEAPAEETTLSVDEKPAAAPLPSKDELKEIFENSVNESISSLLSTLDIKETILASLMPSIKDHAEKVLLETIPDLAKTMLRDALKAHIDTFTKETENLLNDTLPDIIEKTLKEELRNSFEYLMRETGKVICETLPALIEGMLKQQLKDSLESLTKEIEKAIWETIPDLAETMISKEIERIRSEF